MSDLLEEQKLKVNVEFSLEVPIKTDSAGRRISLTNQVAEYIDNYFADLRINQLWNQESTERISLGATDVDMKIYEKITNEDVLNRIKEKPERLQRWVDVNFGSRKSQQAWIEAKDKECLELFGCSWPNFRSLTWEEQQAMRKEHNVVWKDDKWVKEEQ